MRNWVEKLAKLIEREGVCISEMSYKILHYEIYITWNAKLVDIKNTLTEEYGIFKLYEEEQDLLKKVTKRCKERTADFLIEQINNL